MPALPQGEVSGLQWHKNNRDLGFDLTSAKVPSDVYSLDVTTGKIDRWTYSETGGINTNNFSEPQLVHWKSFDGRMISGFEYKPTGQFPGKRPVVINIHGGPESQWRPYYLGRSNYMLDELGAVLIFPNVRGSTGYGKTFALMDNGLDREGSYKDINSLIDWIKEQPDLDSDRIMVMGGSYGGFMTLATATWYSNRIRCALDIVGPSNLVTFLEHTQAYRRDLRRGRIRGRTRSGGACIPRKDCSCQQRNDDPQATVCGAGAERSSRSCERVGANGESHSRKRHSRLVSHGKGRRTRLRQKEKQRLSLLYDNRIHEIVPAQLSVQLSVQLRFGGIATVPQLSPCMIDSVSSRIQAMA